MVDMDFRGCSPRIRPLDVVVGGVVAPDALVGRARELQLAQSAVVTANGAVLVGDRRMGKTSLLRKLELEWRQAGHTVIFVSAQTTSPDTLADRLHEQIAPTSWFKQERRRWALHIKVGAKGITLERTGGRRGDGEAEHVDLLAWAAEKVAPNRLIVMIDELTVLLTAMGAVDDDASEFLNHLRRVRQEHDNLSIVLAGSIGLHHVVPAGSGLVNDLHRIVIGPLDPCDALELALGLFAGPHGASVDRTSAEEITRAASAIPYYVHWLVQQIELDGNTWMPPDERLHNAMNDPLDPLDFRHYRDRLTDYYGEWAELAERMLDHFALDSVTSVDDVMRALGADDLDPRPTRADTVRLLELLENDNYLARLPDGGNEFTSDLLAAAWRVVQRLD